MCGCREHCVCVCMSVCIGPVPTCMDVSVCTVCVCICTQLLWTGRVSLILLRSRSSIAWGLLSHGMYFPFPISHVIAGNTALTFKPSEQIFNEAYAHTAVFRYRCFLLVVIDFPLDILERQGWRGNGILRKQEPSPVSLPLSSPRLVAHHLCGFVYYAQCMGLHFLAFVIFYAPLPWFPWFFKTKGFSG